METPSAQIASNPPGPRSARPVLLEYQYRRYTDRSGQRTAIDGRKGRIGGIAAARGHDSILRRNPVGGVDDRPLPPQGRPRSGRESPSARARPRPIPSRGQGCRVGGTARSRGGCSRDRRPCGRPQHPRRTSANPLRPARRSGSRRPSVRFPVPAPPDSLSGRRASMREGESGHPHNSDSGGSR